MGRNKSIIAITIIVVLTGAWFYGPLIEATAYEGESVFKVFQRETEQACIHMSFRNTPIDHSACLLDVSNLDEFDVGEPSGWQIDD